jgi:hypothetical protein
LKPAWGKQVTKKKKKPITERASGVVQGGGPEFKPQYHKKKNLKMALATTPKCRQTDLGCYWELTRRPEFSGHSLLQWFIFSNEELCYTNEMVLLSNKWGSLIRLRG